MDHVQEPFVASKSVELVPPRLRLTRNKNNRSLLTEDAQSLSSSSTPPQRDTASASNGLAHSSSSSSSTRSQRNATNPFSLAHGPSTIDSPAARLRALTNRVMNGSDLDTDRPKYPYRRVPTLSGELESDVESMIEHSLANLPHPRPRRVSLTATETSPAHQAGIVKSLSTSNEETERVHTPRPRDDITTRRIKPQFQSISALRSMLESSAADIESLEDTPAHQRTVTVVHPPTSPSSDLFSSPLSKPPNVPRAIGQRHEPEITVKSPSDTVTGDDPQNSAASSSAMPKTPAPPGAWVAAPASGSPRKGILKVRFDKTSVAGQIGLDNTLGNEEVDASSRGSPKFRDLRSRTVPPRELDGDAATPTPANSVTTENHDAPSGQSPPVLLKKRRRRLKMVDEFGNELEQRSPIESVASKIGVDDDSPATLEELRGLRAVAQAIPQLAQEFNEENMSMMAPRQMTSLTDQLKNTASITDLKDLSRIARAERARLQRQLQLVRSGEDTLNTEVARLRSTVQASYGNLNSDMPRRWPRLVWVILIIEVFLFWIVLRITSSRAEYLFLTTHYDPFFPALFGPRLPPSALGVHETFPLSLSGLHPPSRLWWASAFIQVLWDILSPFFTLFSGSNEIEFSLPSNTWVPC